jgi:GNAT superfamily N-acetyltransferase
MLNKEAEITIRDACESDSASIAQLLSELGYSNTPKFAKEKIKLISNQKDNKFFVAIMDSQVVGFAYAHILPLLHQPGNACRVTALVVSEKCRKKGIGRKLMETAEDFAKVNDCVKLEITSGDHRSWAHDFYRKIGYQEVSRRFLKIF